MCGIAGMVGATVSTEVVSAIVVDQASRGPDAQAVVSLVAGNLRVVLGHDRLAIVDLSSAANQPMFDGTGDLCVVLNGEIYNYLELRAELVALEHRFRTASDTEVLLEAWRRWGPGALERLNGMFAFALTDRRTGRVWLVRDRFGVKPLYYAFRDGKLTFASTPRALARALGGFRPNLDYVGRGLDYLVYEDDTDIAPYEGMHAVPPGHFVEIVSGRLTVEAKVHRYYTLEGRVETAIDLVASRTTGVLVSEFVELLQSAVDLRFRADVPVGLSLSGGLDSSSIAVLAARREGEVRGFSYGHPEEPGSEGPTVAMVAERCGVQMTWVRSGTGHDLADQFWATLNAQDAPFSTSSVVAQHAIFRATRALGVKVLLGGQGGDEALMGYDKYRLFRLQSLVARGRILDALGTLPGVVRLLSGSLGTGQIRRQVSRYGGRPATRRRLPGLPRGLPVQMRFDSTGPLWRRQVTDVLRTSLPTLLRYEDRNSMGNSVESRLPFLDYRIIELGLALPEGLKLRGGWTKWILREGMTGRLPDVVRLSRTKRGFDTDQQHTVRSGLGRLIRQGLDERLGRLRSALGDTTGMTPRDFSDRRLVADPAAMTEAVSLLWLGSKL